MARPGSGRRAPRSRTSPLHRIACIVCRFHGSYFFGRFISASGRCSHSTRGQPRQNPREEIMTTISFIGAGNIGANVARAAANAGYDVILSNNHGADSLAGLAADIGSRASTASTEDAANQGDVVVIAVPYTAFDSLPTEALAGKVVLATTNYIPEYTGHIAALDD